MAAYPYIFGAGPNAGGLGGGGSIAVAVSNATPTFGQSITITATPTGFAPTSYIFFAYDGSDITWIAEQAGAAVNWTVSLVGSFEVYALGTDGALEVYGIVDVTAASALILDSISTMPNWAVALRRLTVNYLGDCMTVRKSVDGTSASIGFIGEDLDTASLIAHVGVGNGFTAVLFDQIGVNDSIQGTAASQPTVVLSGTVELINARPAIVFDGSNDTLSMLGITFVHGFMVAKKTDDSSGVNYAIGGSGQGILLGGAAAGGALIIVSAGGNISSSLDTTAHQITFRMGSAGTARLRLDGVTVASGTTSADMTISAMGCRPDVASFAKIRISEAFTYASALSDADRNALEANQKAYYGTP